MFEFNRYSIVNNEWTRLADMQYSRELASATVLNGKIYVSGGHADNVMGHGTVERYDPSQNQWKTVARMNSVRLGHGSCTINGTIYVIGGAGVTTKLLDSIEKYDEQIDKWTMVRFEFDYFIKYANLLMEINF